MTTLNLFFTIEYQQPDEYHFSHDSVFLARKVFEIVQKSGKHFDHVLDLCAGCGVVGIDYLYHLQQYQKPIPRKIDFLEVQSIYQKYFIQNISKLSGLNTYRFLTMNYAQIMKIAEFKNQYDLIICNPPYFKTEMGLLSPSEFKNRCRFFIDSNFENLILSIQYLLKPNGQAFVLLKDLTVNGFSIQSELQKFSNQLKITQLEKIRTTDLYMIQSF